MKKIFIAVLLVTMYLPFQDLNAQQVRRPQRGDPGYRPQMKTLTEPYVEERDPNKEVNLILPKCVKEFNLDAFEEEIVKKLLFKKFENQNVILSDKSYSYEDRKKKLLALNKNFYLELSSILTLEEVEHFKRLDFTETREEKKKRKRNKQKKG